jgi:GNAT superfamily N-acetyltransferase
MSDRPSKSHQPTTRGGWWPEGPDASETTTTKNGLVPVRLLASQHVDDIVMHLLGLPEADRLLRFGHATSDVHIRRYAQQLDFDNDAVLGVYNKRLELVGMAHSALSADPDHAACAEFGVSVWPRYRGRGLGAHLFTRAVLHARNTGVRMLFIHALSRNAAMLTMAQKAGARVVSDGTDAEAFLLLPPASLDSHVSEMVGQQVAELDFQLKKQAQQFQQFLQKLRQDRARDDAS